MQIEKRGATSDSVGIYVYILIFICTRTEQRMSHHPCVSDDEEKGSCIKLLLDYLLLLIK